jgi:hypothetical protein
MVLLVRGYVRECSHIGGPRSPWCSRKSRPRGMCPCAASHLRPRCWIGNKSLCSSHSGHVRCNKLCNRYPKSGSPWFSQSFHKLFVLYAVRVVSNESRRLVLHGASCSLLHAVREKRFDPRPAIWLTGTQIWVLRPILVPWWLETELLKTYCEMLTHLLIWLVIYDAVNLNKVPIH